MSETYLGDPGPVARRRTSAHPSRSRRPRHGRHRRGDRRGRLVWWRALLALLVALPLQIGVNYANDYSDGVRGTDDAAGRPDAPGRLGGRHAACRCCAPRWAASPPPRCAGWCWWWPPRAWWLLLVGAAVDRRGLVLHRRPRPVRLPRARRGLGVRLLRPGRRGRHRVRADRGRCPGSRWRRRSRSGCWRARCWWSTTCATSAPTAQSGKRTLAVVLGDAAHPHCSTPACLILPFAVALSWSRCARSPRWPCSPHRWRSPRCRTVRQGAAGPALISACSRPAASSWCTACCSRSAWPSDAVSSVPGIVGRWFWAFVPSAHPACGV